MPFHTVLMTPTFGAKLADLGEATVKNVEETMTQVRTRFEDDSLGVSWQHVDFVNYFLAR